MPYATSFNVDRHAHQPDWYNLGPNDHQCIHDRAKGSPHLAGIGCGSASVGSATICQQPTYPPGDASEAAFIWSSTSPFGDIHPPSDTYLDQSTTVSMTQQHLSIAPMKQKKRLPSQPRTDGGYECPALNCENVFDLASQKTKHVKRAHTDDAFKDFACPSCDKRFVYKRDLKRHEAKKFPCNPSVQTPDASRAYQSGGY